MSYALGPTSIQRQLKALKTDFKRENTCLPIIFLRNHGWIPRWAPQDPFPCLEDKAAPASHPALRFTPPHTPHSCLTASPVCPVSPWEGQAPAAESGLADAQLHAALACALQTAGGKLRSPNTGGVVRWECGTGPGPREEPARRPQTSAPHSASHLLFPSHPRPLPADLLAHRATTTHS